MADDTTQPAITSFKGSFASAMARRAAVDKARSQAQIARYKAVKAHADHSRVVGRRATPSGPGSQGAFSHTATRGPIRKSNPGGSPLADILKRRKPATAIPVIPKRVVSTVNALGERRIMLKQPVRLERVHRNALGGTRPRKGLLT